FYRLLREGIDRADVDLAKDVGIIARCGLRTIEEIGVPDHRQRTRLDAKRPAEGWQPLLFHSRLDGLEVRCSGRVVAARSGLRSLGQSRTGWRGEQRIDLLVPKAGHLVTNQVAANHSFGEPLLIGLVDDVTGTGQVALASGNELADRDVFLDAAAKSMPDAYASRISRTPSSLPPPIAAVSA